MRICKFSVSKLNGFINIVDLDFNDDLTIIIGPNGSGKTSALNLIGALLRLDISSINKAVFKRASLALHDQVLGNVEIIADKDEGTMSLKLSEETCVVPLEERDLTFIMEGVHFTKHIISSKISSDPLVRELLGEKGRAVHFCQG